MKRAKSYRAAAEQIDGDTLYSPAQAARLAKASGTTKFDSTVEVAMRLGTLPAQQEALHREILGILQTLNSSLHASSVSDQKSQVTMQLQPSVQPQINTEASALP